MNTDKILKVAMVSYSNTIPFQYGLEEHQNNSGIKLILDVPAKCAELLKNEEVDIALIPVGALVDFENYRIVSDYCLGAENQVKTVLLLSQIPLNKIEKVFLDNESRSSVNLARILSKNYWKTQWNWENLSSIESLNPDYHQSVVLIGDKAIQNQDSYVYKYDLATAWNAFTNLPFVFAVWVATKEINPKILEEFNEILHFGLENKEIAIERLAHKYSTLDLYDYLNYCISFKLDSAKREAIQKYLNYLYTL